MTAETLFITLLIVGAPAFIVIGVLGLAEKIFDFFTSKR